MIDYDQAAHDERALLGRLMLGARHTNEVFQTLPKEAFNDPRHAQVYDLIFGLHCAGERIDVERVEGCLPYNGDLSVTVGGAGLYAMIVAAETCQASKILSLACVIGERAEEPRPEPPAVQPVEASHRTHLPVSVPGGIIVFAQGAEQAPRCVGKGSRDRCRTGLYPGQWEDWVIEGLGTVEATDGSEGDPNVFLRQRCEKHLGDGQPDVVDPEWEWFSPQRFPGLVSPHRRVWRHDGLMVLPSRPAPRPPAAALPTTTGRPVPQQKPEVPTLLYWHYDADEVLLYIGITDDHVARGKAHAGKSSWVHFAKTSKSVWFPNRAEAEAAERTAIEMERPLFNHVHNDTPEARARLVAYLIEHGRMDLLAPAVSRG